MGYTTWTIHVFSYLESRASFWLHVTFNTDSGGDDYISYTECLGDVKLWTQLDIFHTTKYAQMCFMCMCVLSSVGYSYFRK